jgi:hypothetical protein
MITAIHWREWLRQPVVMRFNIHSPIEVEDYLQATLPNDRTGFVFNDSDAPLMQAIINQWQWRYTTRQLAEIHNALVRPELRVEKFTSKDQAFRQISLAIHRLASENPPLTLTRNPMRKEITMISDDQDTMEHTEQADTESINAADAQVDMAQTAVESKAEMKRQAAERRAAEREEAKARKLAEREATRARKLAEKAASKQSTKSARPTGVIGSLVALLTDGEKRTVDELYDLLAEKFPDRGEGMKTTIRIQLVRLQSEGRLNVYSEERKDENGKRIAGKRYWGAQPAQVQPAVSDTDTDTGHDTSNDAGAWQVSHDLSVGAGTPPAE